jgi:hypothetical protein
MAHILAAENHQNRSFGRRPRGRPTASENAHQPASTLLTITREQYIAQSKGHALALLGAGLIREAVAAMMMDMRKHPDCGVPSAIHAIGVFAAAAGDTSVARAYIDGFK